MFELTMKGTVYQFNFGIGFVREINKTVQQPVDGNPGVKEDIGLAYTIAEILNGDVVTLVDALELANKGKEPRVTRDIIEEYIDDEMTDIDKLFGDVIGFFLASNATKNVAKRTKEAFERTES